MIRPPSRATGVAVLLLAAFLATAYGWALVLPFIFDDYIILEKVRRLSLAQLASRAEPLYGWWRPWSRELHFWTLERVFGAREAPFHAVSFALWLAVMALYAAWVRRVAGARAVWLATAGAAAVVAWSGALLWAAGAQELWMLWFALAMLHAFAARRPWGAALALAGALLSKETAAVLPALALAYARVIDRDPPARALVRVFPLVTVEAAWLVLHPTLLHRLGGGTVESGMEVGTATGNALRTVLLTFNLYRWPRPEGGVGAALVAGLPAFVCLGALASLALRDGAGNEPPRSAAPLRAQVGFAASWMLLGLAPLAAPSIGWNAYYGLLATLGAWMLLGIGLARRPRLGVALVLAVAVLQPLQARTPAWDWSGAWMQRRAAAFVGRLRHDLLARRPSVTPHTRLFFTGVPNAIGIGQPWFEPAFRVWYRDTTVVGRFLSAYRARPPGRPAGPDLFFAYDSARAGWREIVAGPGAPPPASGDAEWEGDRRALAAALAAGEDWSAAAVEFETLARAFPDDPEDALQAGLSRELAGDSAAAVRWYAIAAAHPNASPEAVRFARDFAERWRARVPSIHTRRP